jgi:hypothetical protein
MLAHHRFSIYILSLQASFLMSTATLRRFMTGSAEAVIAHATYWLAQVSDVGLHVAKREATAADAREPVESPQWAAPEALQRRASDSHKTCLGTDPRKADVYSFGMLLYEVMTRQLPYGQTDPDFVLVGVLTRLLPRPCLGSDEKRRYLLAYRSARADGILLA